MKRIRNLLLKNSIFRFLLVGLCSTSIDFVIYMLLSNISINIAKTISMICASIFSYFVNKNYTFNNSETTNIGYLVRFYVVFVINWLVNISINYMMYSLTENKILAFAVATICGMSVNYLGQRFFVFNMNFKETLLEKEYWFEIIGVFSYFCLGLPCYIGENNTTYALEQIHQYNPEIFSNNIAVCTDGMSARFFLNYIVGLGMKLTQGNWMMIAIPLIYFGTLIMAIATVEVIYRISEKNRLLLVIIFSYFIRNSVNALFPGWGTFELSSLGIGIGFAFALLAFSMVIGKKKCWNRAWILLSLAALFHVHEGIWGFCFLFTILIIQVIKEKNVFDNKKQWGLLIFIATIGICVIPGVFTEATGLTSKEFVQIYANFRTPHHLVPSYWGIELILKHLLLIIMSAILRYFTILMTNNEEHHYFLYEAGLAIGEWILALGIVYIFTEIYPMAAIVTMFIPKYFRYIGFLTQVWGIKDIRDWIEKGENWIAGVVVVAILLGSDNGILGILAIYGTILGFLLAWNKYSFRFLKHLLCLILIFLAYGMGTNKGVMVSCLVLSAILYIYILIQKRCSIQMARGSILGLGVICICLLGVASKDRLWNIEGQRIKLVSVESYLYKATGLELYQLAKNFSELTEESDSYITDSYDETSWWFQLASERNCYVNYKNVPSTQSKIKEWYERMIQTKELFEKDIADIKEIMRDGKVSYILVKQNYYNKFDDEDYFILIDKSEGDMYRIYKLTEM